MTPLRLSLLIALALPGGGALAQSLPDIDFLALRIETEGQDSSLSEGMFLLGDQMAAEEHWAAAYKAYGEAALAYPTPEGLARAAAALARIPREDDSCETGYAGKLADLAGAFRLMASAARLSSDRGEPLAPDAPMAAITAEAETVNAALSACP